MYGYHRVLKSVFALLLLLISFEVSIAENKNYGWQRVGSETSGYSIEYQKEDWIPQFIYSKSDVPEYVIVEKALFTCKTGARISVDVWIDQTNRNTSEWIDDQHKIFTFSSSQLKHVTATKENLIALEYEIDTDGIQTFSSRMIFFKYSDRVFRLSYLLADHGASDSVFQYMVASFEFANAGIPISQLAAVEESDLPLLEHDCAGETDDCICGANNPYPCCDYPEGNCTWWAWDQACCEWNDALPGWGNAMSWASNAISNGYTVSSTPSVGTIACIDHYIGDSPGHVAWVLQVNGDQVYVSEMVWCLWGNVNYRSYDVSDFTGGFIYQMGAAAAPTLYSPAHQTEFVKSSNSITFSWSSVPGASQYEIWIDNSPGWSGPEVGWDNGGGNPHLSDGIVSGTQFNLLGSWQQQMEQNYYYWKVRAVGSDNWSETRQFTLLDPLPAPTLYSPAHQTEFVKSSNSITFSWSSVPGASQYEIWIDNSPGWSGPEVGWDNGGGNPHLSDGIVSGTQFNLLGSWQQQMEQNYYYWKVRCVGSDNWSSTRQFTLLDCTPPEQVSGINATDDGCDRIWINWNDLSGESGYRVYRNGGNVSGDLSPGTTSWADYPSVGTYSYTVRAFNQCGEGPNSNADQGQRRQAPPQVTNVNASGDQCDDIRITWADVSNETLYRVYRNGSQIGSDLSANTTSYIDIYASSGVTYSYTVQACNGPTCCGTMSTSSSGTRLSTPPQVTGVSATNNSCYNITISWSNVVGEDGYEVYRNGTQVGGSRPANSTSYTDTPQPGTYSYTVKAFNNCDDGPVSSPASGTRLGPPPLVTGVSASDFDCNVIVVSWDNVDGEDGYKVFRDGNQVGGNRPANSISYTDQVSPGTYNYTVQAFNSCGNGALSSQDSGTRASTLPQVTEVTASNDICYGVVVHWTDTDGELSYRVKRDGGEIGSPSANQTTFTDNTAVPGVNYTYTVAAFGSCGYSPESSPASGTRLGVPDQVLNVSATDNNCNSITVTWDDATDELGYWIFRDGSELNTLNADVNSYIDYNVDPYAVYEYSVFALNECDAGPESTPDYGSCRSTPPQVTLSSPEHGAIITVDVSQIYCWEEVSDAAQYEVKWADNDAFTSAHTEFVDQTCFDYTITSEGTWFWKVRAINDCGSSELWSQVRTLEVESGVLSTPALTSPDEGTTVCSGHSQQYCWSTVTEASQYKILWDDDPNFGSSTERTTTNTCIEQTLTGNGTWHWKVQAEGTAEPSEWSTPRTISLLSQPSTPILLSPANEDTVCSNESSDYCWNSVAGATGYNVKWADNIDFIAPIDRTAPSTCISQTINGEGNWFWKVQAENNCGIGSWSSPCEIFVESPPGEVSLNSPIDAFSVCEGQLQEYCWNAVSEATSYTIEWADNPDFNSALLYQTADTCIERSLNGSGTWFWHCWAANGCDDGPCSTDRTIEVSSEPAVTILSPNGGETWSEETDHQVTWEASGCAAESFTIKLSTNSGASYPTTLGTAPRGATSFDWDNVGPVSSTLRVKVIVHSAAGDAEDESDADFTICGDAMTLDIAEATGATGSPVTVPVTVTNFSNVAGVQLSIAYETTMLQFLEATTDHLGGFLSNATGGNILIVWDDFENPLTLSNGSTLFSLVFSVLGIPGSETDLIWNTSTCELSNELGTPIPCVGTENGTVTIVDRFEISGQVALCCNPVQGVSGVGIDLTGDISGSTTTDGNGDYMLSEIAPGSCMLMPSLSVPWPSGVSISDVIKLRRHLANIEPFDSPCEMIAGDINESNTVTISDVIKVRRYLAQLENLQSGDWHFVNSDYALDLSNWDTAPGSRSYNPIGQHMTDQDFVAIRMGDVNCSWSPSVALGLAHGYGNTNEPHIRFDQVAAGPGEEVIVNVIAARIPSLAGLELHFDYPANLVELQSYNSPTMPEPTVKEDPGSWHFVWDDFQQPIIAETETVLISLTFRVIGQAGDVANLHFSRVTIADSYGNDYNGVVVDGEIQVDTLSGLTYGTDIVEHFAMHPVYPNPFNSTATLNFDVPITSPIQISVYNILGHRISNLVDKTLTQGRYTLNIDAHTWATGTYLIAFKSPSFHQIRKMLLLK